MGMEELKKAVEGEGGNFAVIAPKIGGVTTSAGNHIAAGEKLDGGPSVLFDAVVIALTKEGTELLLNEATARDFVADAFAHLKFIGHTPESRALLDKAGVPEEGDEGIIELSSVEKVSSYIAAARELRLWGRESK